MFVPFIVSDVLHKKQHTVSPHKIMTCIKKCFNSLGWYPGSELFSAKIILLTRPPIFKLERLPHHSPHYPINKHLMTAARKNSLLLVMFYTTNFLSDQQCDRKWYGSLGRKGRTDTNSSDDINTNNSFYNTILA